MKLNYKRFITTAIISVFCATNLLLFAQEEDIQPDTVVQPELDQEDANRLAGTGDANFQEISVDLFEDPTLWDVHISVDDGYSTHRRFPGTPAGKVPWSDVQLGANKDVNVLGIRTQFIRRGFTEIVFRPQRPISIPGYVADIKLWVAGRELPHELCVRVRDINFRTRELCSTKRLNFRGWEEVTMQIPPYVRLGTGIYTGVQQYDPRRPFDTGLELVAIVIKPLFTEAYGTYYVYFDDMRATTDISVISLTQNNEGGDIVDAW